MRSKGRKWAKISIYPLVTRPTSICFPMKATQFCKTPLERYNAFAP